MFCYHTLQLDQEMDLILDEKDMVKTAVEVPRCWTAVMRRQGGAILTDL